MNIFNGTQCVPQQITETFLLKNKVPLLARTCIDDESSACVKDVLKKLTDHARFASNKASDGLSSLGSGKLIHLDACMLVALEDLLNLTVDNPYGKMYYRFLYDHKLYSSLAYTQSKRHTNHDVPIRHPASKYGRIVGLLEIKPLCFCTLQRFQYCNCTLYKVVLVKLMHASQRILFKDVDFHVTSNFIAEVEESDELIALYPSEIDCKCICVNMTDKTYFCPLPYRIHDD